MGWTGTTPKSVYIQLITWDGQKYQGTVVDIMANDGKWVIDNVDLTQGVCYIGTPYEFIAKLSTLYIRQVRQDGSTQAKASGRLQLRDVRINYDDTGSLGVTVKSSSGKEREYTMTSRILGTASATLGIQPSGTGQFRVPIQSQNTKTEITLHSSEPLPLSILGFIWEGSFISRTKEV